MIYYCAPQAPIFRNYAHARLKEFINEILRKRAEINRAKATPLRWPVFRIRGNETPFRITETISGPGGIYKKGCFYNKIYCKTYLLGPNIASQKPKSPDQPFRLRNPPRIKESARAGGNLQKGLFL